MKALYKITVCLIFSCILFVFSGCKDKGYGYDDPFVSMLSGKWYINDESEYITFYEDGYMFEMNDWEITGNFVMEENKPNQVYVMYEDAEGNDYFHVMRLHSYLGSNRSMWVDDAPMHEGERVLFYRP